MHNLVNFGGLYLAIERQFAKFAKVWHHQSLALYGSTADTSGTAGTSETAGTSGTVGTAGTAYTSGAAGTSGTAGSTVVVVIEICGVENGDLAVPVNNTLVCCMSFLAADTRPCVLKHTCVLHVFLGC